MSSWCRTAQRLDSLDVSGVDGLVFSVLLPDVRALRRCLASRQARALSERWELEVGVLVSATIQHMMRGDGSLRFGVASLADGDIGIEVPF